MAWTTVNCDNCNSDFEVQLYGKIRDREWKVANWVWVCDECKEKINKETNEKAAKVNEAVGLPELEGSEKQIAWAETIRANQIEYIEDQIETGFKDDDGLRKVEKEKIQAGLLILKSEKQTSVWIDERNSSPLYRLKQAIKKVKSPEQKIQNTNVADIQKEIEIEATVRPIKSLTETVAIITKNENKISIKFPEKRDDFKEIVKIDCHYRWNWDTYTWQRSLTTTEGTVEDRMAEVGYRLLSAGFIIRIIDEKIRKAAIDGKYEKECLKWIFERQEGKYKGWFAINWKKGSGDYYDEAKKITGSRWNKPSVMAPAAQYEEVLDFASVNEFKLTDKALRLSETAKEDKLKTLIVSITPKKSQKPKKVKKESGKMPVLDIPENVKAADALKD